MAERDPFLDTYRNCATTKKSLIAEMSKPCFEFCDVLSRVEFESLKKNETDLERIRLIAEFENLIQQCENINRVLEDLASYQRAQQGLPILQVFLH